MFEAHGSKLDVVVLFENFYFGKSHCFKKLVRSFQPKKLTGEAGTFSLSGQDSVELSESNFFDISSDILQN